MSSILPAQGVFQPRSDWVLDAGRGATLKCGCLADFGSAAAEGRSGAVGSSAIHPLHRGLRWPRGPRRRALVRYRVGNERRDPRTSCGSADRAARAAFRRIAPCRGGEYGYVRVRLKGAPEGCIGVGPAHRVEGGKQVGSGDRASDPRVVRDRHERRSGLVRLGHAVGGTPSPSLGFRRSSWSTSGSSRSWSCRRRPTDKCDGCTP
jgi:hypothetical protein